MNNWTDRLFLVATVLLAAFGYWLYSQASFYTYMSDEHFLDLIRARGFTLSWLIISIALVGWRRHEPYAPKLAVFCLSCYFVVLYGLLFIGTEYGMNGHWGDNGNRLALIAKMMAFDTIFTDWYLKDLPSFYPPGWFALMAVYAKVIGIEAYQTIKFGYLLIFLTYPWLLYWSWLKLVSRPAAAAIALATIFLGFKFLDWTYYEHITAALFIPWWLYYFENSTEKITSGLKKAWPFYLIGSLFGAALFITYYYWFFIAAIVLPVTLVAKYAKTRSLKLVADDLIHKTILMAGVAILTAVYWLPLLRSLYWNGIESYQGQWFGMHHADLSGQWPTVSLDGMLLFAGSICLFYLWQEKKIEQMKYLFLGGLLIIIADRVMNLTGSSIQSRKVLELAHVFTMAPLAIGCMQVWSKLKTSLPLRRGIVGLLVILSISYANAHVQDLNDMKYKAAINQRVPEADLDVFRTVDSYGTVFLTNNYREACYLPYYLFIPYNTMTAHAAGRYSQRELFLDKASEIIEPALLAYALAYNRYSPVDYIYLPFIKETDRFEQTLYQPGFSRSDEVKMVKYQADHRLAPETFVKKHERGMYQIVAVARNAETDNLLNLKYPDIWWHLEPTE